VLEAVTVCASNVDIVRIQMKQSGLRYAPGLDNPVRKKGGLVRQGGNGKKRTLSSTFCTCAGGEG
jgi:hypothetical protein